MKQVALVVLFFPEVAEAVLVLIEDGVGACGVHCRDGRKDAMSAKV